MQQQINKKNSLKIIMVEPLGDGGIAHYAYNLLNTLSASGVEASLFTNKAYEFESAAVEFRVYSRMFRFANHLVGKYPFLNKEYGTPSVIRRVIKLIEYPLNTLEALFLAASAKANLVHLQSVNLIELFMIIAFRVINRKVVYTIHNIMPRHKTPKFYHIILYRIMYMLCNQIIIHSEKGKEDVIGFFKVRRNKIHVIPHGDYKFFVPKRPVSKRKAKLALGILPTCKTILFFGAVRQNKGLKNILIALPQIKKKVPNVKLLIVGEPWENYDKYRRIITEEGIDNEIYEKLDYVSNEEVPLYFYATDLAVLPYNEITQSGILQIAYAFGKPVVATDLAGFREAVEDGRNGYLVPLRDAQSLAEKCIAVLNDNKKMQEMGGYSKHLADTKFSWDSIAGKTKQVYELCLTA